jgi:uncharacterized protein (TIGR02270 family)
MPRVIASVVLQHAEEAALLWHQRRSLLTAPHIDLQSLHDHDERLQANLDGLAIAADDGWHILASSRDDIGRGAVFAAAVLALRRRDPSRVDELLEVAEADPEVRVELLDALGWVSADVLTGQVHGLLTSERPLRRAFGIAACASHGRNPGAVLDAVMDGRTDLCALALRAIGEAGDVGRLPQCLHMLNAEGPICRASAARAAVLLGNHGLALEALWNAAMADASSDDDATTMLSIQAMTLPAARAHLKLLSRTEDRRRLVRASGVVGDIAYMPWLIEQMHVEMLARVAGEAFTLISGGDLHTAAFTRPAPTLSGPNDDPNDADVELDPDDSLPWPEASRVDSWWASNSDRFVAGTRYFLGFPVTREHCIHVLKTGYQRQRILAAHYLCLLNPGTPLFNTSAPAWRQQRLLAQMQ